MQALQSLLKWVKRQTDRSFFPALVGGLAFLDYFVLVIPTDGIYLSSVMSAPHRKRALFLWTSLGSTLGGIAFTALVGSLGMPFLESYFSSVLESSAWKTSEDWMNRFGLAAVFMNSALPALQHPVLALATLSGMKLLPISGAFFLGRILKFAVLLLASRSRS